MLPSPKQRRYHPEMTSRAPLLPYCLASGAPDDVIRVLLEVDEHRQTLSIPDKLGRLPLHIACRFHASKLLVADLVIAYPRATIIQDREGNLPLHYAVLAACKRKTATTAPKKRSKNLAKKANTSKTTTTSEESCSSASTSSTDDARTKRDCLEIINNLLITAPTSILTVNNVLVTPLSLAIRLEDGSDGAVEQTPVCNLMSSVASAVMHDWETHQSLTEDNINEMTGLYDESFLDRRRPEILSTSSVVKHFLFGR